MFNLTVDTAHTFYVGSNGWLVHNCADSLMIAADALGWGNGSSVALRANMKVAGAVPPRFPNAAHHIVAHDDPRAVPAVRVMIENGIHADDAANGVFLRYSEVGSGANHRVIHTNAYYAEVNRRVLATKSKGELIMTLRDIADELRAGTFPY